MTTHLQAIADRLEELEEHIEQRHREARHERKTLMSHLRNARLHLEALRKQAEQ